MALVKFQVFGQECCLSVLGNTRVSHIHTTNTNNLRENMGPRVPQSFPREELRVSCWWGPELGEVLCVGAALPPGHPDSGHV